MTDQQSEAEHDKNDEDDDHVVVSDVFVIDSISMADWDADDFDPDAGLAAPKASDKWEGEDEDDDIKVIVKFNQGMDEIFFIKQGQVRVFDKTGSNDFLILPEKSWFGDYQVLL